MAKIRTAKYEVKGIEYKININCTSQGVFTANIPRDISNALKVDSRIMKSTLGELEEILDSAFRKYKESNTTEELYIFIKYGSGGKFNRDSKGEHLFFSNTSDYGLRSDWNRIENVLGFDYKVCMKIIVDGKVSWYDTRFGFKDFMDNPEEGEEKKYQKGSHIHNQDKFKKIPFSKESLETLDKIYQSIRGASETLFRFVDQDENQIQTFLETGNMNLLYAN